MTVRWTENGSPNWADGNVLTSADLGDTINGACNPRFDGGAWTESKFIPVMRILTENLLYGKTTTPTTGSNAVDGDASTFYPAGSFAQGQVGSEILRVDYGSAISGCFSIRVGGWVASDVCDFAGQYSLNGTDWTTFDSTAHFGNTSEVVFALNSSSGPVPFRYVRLAIGSDTNTSPGYGKIYEITAWKR